MNSDAVVGLMAEAIRVTMLISAPVLLVGLIVGVIISILQAVTQIQEITLVFVPKIIAVMVVLIVALPWMLRLMVSYTQQLIMTIPMLVR